MSDAEVAEHEPSRRPLSRLRDLPPGFGVLWTTVAVDMLGFGIVVPLLPLYARRLGAGPPSVGLLLATFSAAQLAGAPLLGRLSDRVGRKPVLVLSLVGTAGASLLTGVAGSLWLLLVARFLDGASGGSVAVAQAAATDMVDTGQRARVLGLLGAAFGVGFVVGPAVGGLAALGGTRLPFFVAAGIAALNAARAVRRLPSTARRPWSARTGWASSVGRAAPGRRAERAERVVRIAQMGRGSLRSIAAPAVVTVLMVGAFSAFEATFPLFGHRRLGFGLADIGAVFALVGLVAAGVQAGLVRPLAARLGDAGCLRVGLAAEGLGLVLLSSVHTRVELVVPLALVTAGQSLCSPALGAVVAGRVAEGDRGGALGTQQGCSALARMIGPALGGAAYGLLGSGAPLVGGGAVVIGALLFSLVMRGGLAPSGA
jgi:MFS transporter, DHA1 family, tetracycline resistance protein